MNNQFDFSGVDAAILSGLSIWKSEKVIGTGATSNLAAQALKSPFKAEDLTPGTVNYLVDKFGKIRMVARVSGADKSLAFISPLHDKNGQPILSQTNTYRIEQVVCVKDFQVPNSEKIIKVGDRMLKAYAV
jgi:hypothetical protein